MGRAELQGHRVTPTKMVSGGPGGRWLQEESTRRPGTVWQQSVTEHLSSGPSGTGPPEPPTAPPPPFSSTGAAVPPGLQPPRGASQAMDGKESPIWGAHLGHLFASRADPVFWEKPRFRTWNWSFVLTGCFSSGCKIILFWLLRNLLLIEQGAEWFSTVKRRAEVGRIAWCPGDGGPFLGTDMSYHTSDFPGFPHQVPRCSFVIANAGVPA